MEINPRSTVLHSPLQEGSLSLGMGKSYLTGVVEMWWDRWAGEEVAAPSLKVSGLIWGRKMGEMSLPGPFQTCFL